MVQILLCFFAKIWYNCGVSGNPEVADVSHYIMFQVMGALVTLELACQEEKVALVQDLDILLELVSLYESTVY